MYFPIEESDVDCYMSVKSVYPNGVERSFPYSYDNYNEQITESEEKEEPTLIDGKYDLDKIKKALKILSQISTSFGEFISLEFKLYGYEINRGVMVLYIDVDSEDGVYDVMSGVWYEIGQQILEIFQMMGIRDEKHMWPLYDFKFNKRPLYNIETV